MEDINELLININIFQDCVDHMKEFSHPGDSTDQSFLIISDDEIAEYVLQANEQRGV